MTTKTANDWLLPTATIVVSLLITLLTICFYAGSYTRQIDNNVEDIASNEESVKEISRDLYKVVGEVKTLAQKSAYLQAAYEKGFSSKQIDTGLQAIQTMPRSEAIMFLEDKQGFSEKRAEGVYDAAESLKETQKIR